MSIDARLATAAEVAEHIRNGADTGIVGPGSVAIGIKICIGLSKALIIGLLT